MGESQNRQSLEKIAQAIKSLDPDKQIAAAKWLEGVIVAQILTPKERETIVNAANEYIENVEEHEYTTSVNALMEFLSSIQRNAKRTLKRKNNKRLAENCIPLGNPTA